MASSYDHHFFRLSSLACGLANARQSGEKKFGAQAFQPVPAQAKACGYISSRY
jgi:hypothetical protein